jgi:Domain of unknown function (DUF4381)
MARNPLATVRVACLALALLVVMLVTAPIQAAGTVPPMTVTGPTTPLSDASTEDIRDIRGPKGVFPAWIIPALIAGAVALALGGYAFWRWRRRQRPVRPLLPFEVALQRLEHIRTLMRPAQVREFSIAITDIVRAYIEQRFDVTATHQTTEEFLHDLLKSSRTALASHRDLLAQFLQQCDLAKFAGMSLSQSHMESLHASARTFVLETAKPEPPPAPNPVPAAVKNRASLPSA